MRNLHNNRKCHQRNIRSNDGPYLNLTPVCLWKPISLFVCILFHRFNLFLYFFLKIHHIQNHLFYSLYNLVDIQSIKSIRLFLCKELTQHYFIKKFYSISYKIWIWGGLLLGKFKSINLNIADKVIKIILN